ncbi:sulfur carrier protein ThiS [Vibrio cholerae]|nr:sulfur carrier protein ThiS [Vibrio cholerae]EHY0935764.1 sulfur carrier protein ThiS [Vibrio cholerae]EJL6278005.1 sulfur carrier protein ThiS [Vibrio cholerae]EJL6581999.1 sulfur carrier protein ThiS [Vibrio cholerae]EJL6596390.1 sulfur carrier protein ThiS [Vibrio cholerae]
MSSLQCIVTCTTEGAATVLMTIYLNQQAIQTDISSSLFHLHAQLSLPSQGCVFSLNGQVVPRSEWQHTKLNSGDEISLFQAIAGG